MEYQDILTVAVANFKIFPRDKKKNLARLCGFAEAAAKRGADLIVLPETCVSGYDVMIDETVPFAEKLAIAEPLGGESCQALGEIAKKYGVYIVFGMPEKDPEQDVLYNSAFSISPDGTYGVYRKIHPFGPENTWCKKGDKPFMLDTPWGPVGIGICYDSYQFPELMRYYASQGARLYLNLTALVEDVPKNGSREYFRDYYWRLLEYGVKSNTIYIASSNLVGVDEVDVFGGGAAILGPALDTYEDTFVETYAGDWNCTREGIFLGTIDLALATRDIFENNPISGEPDYRPEVYKNF